ncbi:MAG: metalloregulator ArsR/SmtB family transcription factor [Parvularculales bacterium]
MENMEGRLTDTLCFYIFRIMEMKNALVILSALSQETRLAAFRALVSAYSPDGTGSGLAAGNLAQLLDVPSATLSFHLKDMTNAGLITVRREGRSLIYEANLTCMNDLVEWLLEDCCGGACHLSYSAKEQEKIS